MITAVIKFRDEETFLDEAIQSITPFVDKVVLVNNNSRDNSRSIAEKHVTDTVKLFDFNLEPGTKECPLIDYYNWCNDLVDTEFVLKYDADVVALDGFAEYTEQARTGQFDMLSFYVHNLYADHKHLRSIHGGKIGGEPFIFKKKFRYQRHPEGYAVIYKRGHKVLEMDGCHALHLNIKSPERYLLRKFHHDHRNLDSLLTLEEWVKQNYDWQSLLIENEKTILHDITPYQGEYPSILDKYLSNPRWVVRYENNKPSDRIKIW
jgi:glycosyltransferase involved in cell wall biosynthesis